MAASNWALTIATIFSALIFGYYASDKSLKAYKKARNKGAQGLNSENYSHKFGKLLRNGIPATKPLARAFMKIAWVKSKAESYCAINNSKHVSASPIAVCSVWLAICLFLIAIGTLIGASWVFGLAAALCFSAACNVWLDSKCEKRTREIQESIPDVLRSITTCFNAGLSLEQTLKQIAGDSQGACKDIFQESSAHLLAGGTASEALELLRKNSLTQELSFVSVALEIQHISGGSIKQVLDCATLAAENQIELRRKLQVQTAQAQLSAKVVTLMPFVLITLFSLISKDFLAPFFASPVGIALFALAIAMEVIGVLIVRSSLQIKVNQ